MRLLVQQITQRYTAAVILALEGIFFLSTMDLLGQLSGVKLGISFQHGFQNDALRSVGDMLFGGNDFHAVLFQNVLVMRAVVAVTGETVEFPDKHDLKKALCAVLDHTLKLRTVSGFRRQCAVDVAADNRYAVALCVFAAFTELTFNRFFPLAVGGIAGIDHRVHSSSPSPLSRASSVSSRSLFCSSFLSGKCNV